MYTPIDVISRSMPDEHGVDTIPIALASSFIILSIIVGLAAMGVKNAGPMVSMASVDGQISALSNDCKAMLAGSPGDLLDPYSTPGASKAVTLTLPDDTEYVAFGIDPDAGGGDEGAIYYKVHGSKKAVVIDKNIKFREGTAAGPSQGHKVLRGGGRYELTVEYDYDRALREKYITIY